jgi:hypothetical protein
MNNAVMESRSVSRDRVASRGWLEREINSGGVLPGQVEIVNKFVPGSPGHQIP